MAQRYNNRVELKDGEVILFHRAGAKRPIWHMRLHVRGMIDIDGKKFSHVQETTGELDLDEAKRVALTPWQGDADNWTPPAMAEALAAALPGPVTLNRLPGCSHYSALRAALARL